ncbi:MAG: zinc ribbon domain-containing protein [Actinomycetota bacterium]|nr:zinc ribbon domain-containing protein [Actinomycetota bacterium]
MKCANCGSEMKAGSRFCTNCGAVAQPPVPHEAQTHRPPGQEGTQDATPASSTAPTVQTAQPQIPVPPPPPMEADMAVPQPPPEKRVGKGWVIAIIVGVVIIAGTASGLLVWKFTGGDKFTAEIVGLELVTAQGREVDLKDVPLGEGLYLNITVEVDYGDKGEASLSVAVLDGSDEEVLSDTSEVEAAKGSQTIEFDFLIRWSEGETFTAKVELEAEEGGEKITAADSLKFYIEEGMSSEMTLEMALMEAEDKLDEANDAVVDLISTTDVNTEDLVQRLTTAYADLDKAEDDERAASIYKTGEELLAECASRKAAWEEKQRQQDEAARQSDIAACQQAMLDYAWNTMTQCEPVRIDNFWMNDARTEAAGIMVGMATAHRNPEQAGDIFMVPINAYKQNGQWVASFVSST